MNEQFESLPFAAEAEMEGEMEGEMQSERSRGGGRGMSRPSPRMLARPQPRTMSRPQPRPGPRPGPRSRPQPRPQAMPSIYGWPRRRRPVFGPYYGGGWPYPVALAQPYPEPFPYPEPQAEPEPEPEPQAQPDFAADDQGEVPPTIVATVGRLPAAQRPAYQALGAIPAALANPAASGPGLYLIEFTSNGRQRAYSGQTNDLRRRLQQHLLCAQMMGLSLANHQVYVAQLPTLSDTRRRALERRIHADMLANNAGVLTNQRREMEQEILGYEW